MNKLNKVVFYYVSVILMFSLTAVGCMSANDRDFSGFLKGSSKMEPVKVNNMTISWKWENPAFKNKSYTKVYVEPVEIFPKPVGNEKINSGVYKGIHAYLTDAVKREISQVAKVVDKVDESTVRLRSAITYAEAPVKAGKPQEYVPVALVIAGVKDENAARNNGIKLYLEAELIDGLTNKRVYAGIRHSSGTDVRGTGEPITLPYVQPILDMWANDAKTFVIDTDSVEKQL